MKPCDDCSSTGTYLGAGLYAPEKCRTCKGFGFFGVELAQAALDEMRRRGFSIDMRKVQEYQQTIDGDDQT